MPVRSLTSPVLRWPDRATVDDAVRQLARRLARAHPQLRRFGYFGSYARGDWGVGSDVDLIAIVGASARAYADRALEFDLAGLPVPAELVVYTEQEWDEMSARAQGFAQQIRDHAVWVL